MSLANKMQHDSVYWPIEVRAMVRRWAKDIAPLENFLDVAARTYGVACHDVRLENRPCPFHKALAEAMRYRVRK